MGTITHITIALHTEIKRQDRARVEEKEVKAVEEK